MKWKLMGFIKEDPYQGDPPAEPPIECESELCGGQWLIDKFGWTPEQVAALDSDVTGETGDDDAFEFQGGDIGSLFTGARLEWQQPGNVAPVLDPETGLQVINGDNPLKPAAMIALFDYFRFRDGDLNDATWTTTIPIYEDDPDDCMNPNALLGIDGFTDVIVYNVQPQPDRALDVWIDCDMKVISGRGGSGIGTVRGTIPNLVE
jgi:hypothetical protein